MLTFRRFVYIHVCRSNLISWFSPLCYLVMGYTVKHRDIAKCIAIVLMNRKQFVYWHKNTMKRLETNETHACYDTDYLPFLLSLSQTGERCLFSFLFELCVGTAPYWVISDKELFFFRHILLTNMLIYGIIYLCYICFPTWRRFGWEDVLFGNQDGKRRCFGKKNYILR